MVVNRGSCLERVGREMRSPGRRERLAQLVIKPDLFTLRSRSASNRIEDLGRTPFPARMTSQPRGAAVRGRVSFLAPGKAFLGLPKAGRAEGVSSALPDFYIGAHLSRARLPAPDPGWQRDTGLTSRQSTLIAARTPAASNAGEAPWMAPA